MLCNIAANFAAAILCPGPSSPFAFIARRSIRCAPRIRLRSAYRTIRSNRRRPGKAWSSSRRWSCTRCPWCGRPGSRERKHPPCMCRCNIARNWCTLGYRTCIAIRRTSRRCKPACNSPAGSRTDCRPAGKCHRHRLHLHRRYPRSILRRCLRRHPPKCHRRPRFRNLWTKL